MIPIPKALRRFFDSLDDRPLWHASSIALALLVLFWTLDFAMGPELKVSFLYIIPIAIMVRRVGKGWSVLMPAVCAFAWLSSELAAGKTFPHWGSCLWEVVSRFLFFLLFAQFVTARRNHDLEMLARQAADESSRLKSNLVSLVSHEYGNALTSMKLSVLLLRQSDHDNPVQLRENCYGILERGIEHLRIASANFLDLNRLQSGHLQLRFGSILARALADETVLLLRPMIDAKGLRLVVYSPTEPLAVRADAGALSLVMSNLLNNAVKYTPKGGSITVRIALEGEHAVFSVTDTGIGIAADDRDRILSGFYRTEASRKIAKGSGVGLTLVKELIERHGSRLEIASEIGCGSNFSFSLPIWSVDPQGAACDKKEQRPALAVCLAAEVP